MKIDGNARKQEIGGSDGDPLELPKLRSFKVIDLKSLNYSFYLEIQASTNPEGNGQGA
jgi:hypothetical protein